MRIIIFFDLPTITHQDRKEYRKFRKYLISEGFIMMQQSVYCKLVLNSTVKQSVMQRIKRNKPKKGLVQSLVITEKQFSSIDYIVGETNNIEIRDDDDRIVIL